MPIRQWDDISPYIDRLVKGEHDALTQQTPLPSTYSDSMLSTSFAWILPSLRFLAQECASSAAMRRGRRFAVVIFILTIRFKETR